MSRVPGTPNKNTSEMRLDLLATLREKGFDPVARLVEVHNDASTEYKKRLKERRTGFGCATLMQIAATSAADIMEFVYPKLKSVEMSGKDGADFFESLTQVFRRAIDMKDVPNTIADAAKEIENK